jgi:Spy/CpxP family protein refolding chaperone
MKRVQLIMAVVIFGTMLSAQPGHPEGPGGQYGQKMEMMAIWKMTEYLNLSEEQAEKFFPRLKDHRQSMEDLNKQEKELFKPLADKIKDGKEISKSELKTVLDKVEKLEEKRTKQKNKFVRNMGDILTPTQQVKLILFEGRMKKAIKDRMREYQRGPDHPRKRNRMGRRPF